MSTKRTTATRCLLAALVFGAAMQPSSSLAENLFRRQIPLAPQFRMSVPNCAPGQTCAVQSLQFGLRCRTNVVWCGLTQPAPLGTPCTCSTQDGTAQGRVTE